jgi:plastocyanin
VNKTTRTLLAVSVIAILAVGGYLALRSPKSDSPNSSSSSSQQPSESNQNNTTPATTSPGTNTTKEAAATITFDGKGFSPASVTVKAGDTIRITNSSSDPLSFNSDPHPTHTDEPELNVGDVSTGSSQTFTVTKSGTWGYHNHFDQSQRGSITVQ